MANERQSKVKQFPNIHETKCTATKEGNNMLAANITDHNNIPQ